jgi:hypothetical protein
LKALILDASIAAVWLLPDENSVIADMAFDLVFMNRAYVPAHFSLPINLRVSFVASRNC